MFEDLDITEDDILGKHVFENVLYTEDTKTPVDALKGEEPEYSKATVEDAKKHAERNSDDVPHVARKQSIEGQVETASKPYLASVFYHFSMTGGLQMHKGFKQAYKSDEYNVEFEADYETGDLTIEVTKSS